MKVVIQHPAPVEIGGRKIVWYAFFGLLVLLATFVGAASGLILVYSTDLPQVEELEHYRPSSVTELYDGSGRVIGTFALQRRVVASYDDYPLVLRDALVSIEDKDFYTHSGINLWRILGAAVGVSQATWRAGLSSRRPRNDAWRRRPSSVQLLNCTSATNSGRTQ